MDRAMLACFGDGGMPVAAETLPDRRGGSRGGNAVYTKVGHLHPGKRALRFARRVPF